MREKIKSLSINFLNFMYLFKTGFFKSKWEDDATENKLGLYILLLFILFFQ